jgi:hypothetical protein
MGQKQSNTAQAPSPSKPQAEIEKQISRVGERLRRSLGEVLAAVPGGPRRPVELSRALGVNEDLAGKALTATNTADPLAATHLMPGPEALRTLLKAARRKVGKSVVGPAEEAVQEFQNLLRNVTGGRAELDAIISAWLPDARARFEMSNKQLAFKANCSLKGVVADVGVTSAVFHPSDDGIHCDAVLISGRIGLRRLRPGATICCSSAQTGPMPPGFGWTTLDGEPVDALKANVLLPQFCSSPTPSLDIRVAGKTVLHLLGGDDIGLDSAVDIFYADVARKVADLYQDPNAPRKKGFSAEVDLPFKSLVLDVLLHESVWPGGLPELIIYDTAIRGVADINDPGRDIDRLDLLESVHALGHGAATFRIAEASKYVELIRYACEKLGWDEKKFRGYRCAVRYPFYGSQLAMAFDPPLPPRD